MPISLVASGVVTGWALIAAIGAQNAFLLKQGLRREHVLPIVLFCIVSDVVLIFAAVAGLGVLLDQWPALMPVARWAGGLFIIGYGLNSAWRARRPQRVGLVSQSDGPAGADPVSARGSLKRALLTVAALTWLNPHLYVDILMLGTVANSHGTIGRWWFYAGLVVASITWFGALGFGSGKLQPFFARPRAWQALDAGVGVAMVGLGAALLAHG